MTWPEETISSWKVFREIAEEEQAPRSMMMYRGHADAEWTLTPSLLRLLPEKTSAEEALGIERQAIKEFRSVAHLHLSEGGLPRSEVVNLSFSVKGSAEQAESPRVRVPKQNLLEWWAVMQHHSAPTRLLDWTESPYVAAYFAVEKDPKRDGAVFYFHAYNLAKAFEDAFGRRIQNRELDDPTVRHGVFPWAPEKQSARFLAQQGYFTCSANVLGSPHELIDAACGAVVERKPDKEIYRKLIIPAGLKMEFLSRLRVMNIAAHSLFPGIDGLGRSVAEIARLGTNRPEEPPTPSVESTAPSSPPPESKQ